MEKPLKEYLESLLEKSNEKLEDLEEIDYTDSGNFDDAYDIGLKIGRLIGQIDLINTILDKFGVGYDK